MCINLKVDLSATAYSRTYIHLWNYNKPNKFHELLHSNSIKCTYGDLGGGGGVRREEYVLCSSNIM